MLCLVDMDEVQLLRLVMLDLSRWVGGCLGPQFFFKKIVNWGKLVNTHPYKWFVRCAIFFHYN